MEAPALKVLVVDDERPARIKVIRLLKEDPRFVFAGEASDGLEALELLEHLRPDLVVLDIQMPCLDGFELLEALGEERSFAVVFATAYDAHALRAFDTHAVDYLLKPFNAERFQKALDKALASQLAAQTRLAAVIAAGVPEVRQRIALRSTQGAWFCVPMADILRISASDKQLRVLTRASNHFVRGPFRDLATRLDARFVRVHRSEIVNVDAITMVEPWEHGDSLLTLADGSTIVLTRTHRKAFMARYVNG